jgi:hypothetical protein
MCRWTAVVRGAALYGIEKLDHKTLTLMTTCPRSYGAMLHAGFSRPRHNVKDHLEDDLTSKPKAKGQLTWLIEKGDLLLSTEPKVSEREFGFNFQDQGTRNFSLPIYEYLDDDLPDRFEIAEEGMSEPLSKSTKHLLTCGQRTD